MGEDQHPLMCQCCCWATQQMQGQQSCSIWAKYLKQLRSMGTSAPFSRAAFSQTGYALLISSMHRTSRSCGQSAAKVSARRASKSMKIFIIGRFVIITQ